MLSANAKIINSNILFTVTEKPNPLSVIDIENIASLKKLNEKELLKEANITLSFTKALRLAALQNTWSLGDKALLLDNVLKLRQEILIWQENFLHKIKFSPKENLLTEKIKNYSSCAFLAASMAITALARANTTELLHALESVHDHLEEIIKIFTQLISKKILKNKKAKDF